MPIQALVGDVATATALAALILRHDLTSRIEVASAQDAVLAETARLVPGVRTVLYAASPGGAAGSVVDRASAVGAATVAVDVHRLSLETVDSAHAAGLRVTGLAVDTLDLLRLARALGLDGAVTDFPEIRSTGRFTA